MIQSSKDIEKHWNDIGLNLAMCPEMLYWNNDIKKGYEPLLSSHLYQGVLYLGAPTGVPSFKSNIWMPFITSDNYIVVAR